MHKLVTQSGFRPNPLGFQRMSGREFRRLRCGLRYCPVSAAAILGLSVVQLRFLERNDLPVPRRGHRGLLMILALKKLLEHTMFSGVCSKSKTNQRKEDAGYKSAERRAIPSPA